MLMKTRKMKDLILAASKVVTPWEGAVDHQVWEVWEVDRQVVVLQEEWIWRLS
jgi:hypothetical protein